MSERSDKDLVEDVLICLAKIQKYIAGLTYKDFAASDVVQDAVIRNLEIVGEATKRLSLDIKECYQAIPWKLIAGTRDRLIHGYFGVNVDIVWEIATTDVPVLREQFENLKRERFG